MHKTYNLQNLRRPLHESSIAKIGVNTAEIRYFKLTQDLRIELNRAIGVNRQEEMEEKRKQLEAEQAAIEAMPDEDHADEPPAEPAPA